MRIAILALLLTACAPRMHPADWTPYSPAEERECEWDAWSRSMWAWIDDRYIDRDIYEACLKAKGFVRR